MEVGTVLQTRRTRPTGAADARQTRAVHALEDNTLARRWSEGHISIDGLLAYSSVCGTGLDTIPLPGSISTLQIERMLSDTASLAYKWNKPLSVRLLPVPGKVLVSAGERVQASQTIAQAEISGEVRIVNVARMLRVPPARAARCR